MEYLVNYWVIACLRWPSTLLQFKHTKDYECLTQFMNFFNTDLLEEYLLDLLKSKKEGNKRAETLK